MFSALKRLTSRSDANGVPTNTPPGLTTMSSALQKKFSKGVQYNMKIILKGDRNSGKTCLFRRLQGLPFIEEYTPTDEIQAANIQWNYKTTDDVVKVEVWDVVDKAKKKKCLPNKLKIENSHSKGQSDDGTEDVQEIGLDASFLDVYKNTNGVILCFDITKNWTYEYVKREVTSVPSHIPILILGNHRDMGHHRAIATDTVHYFIESLFREEDSAEIRYAESSMRNGFGLKYIHKFFNLPFLQLQRETLLKQLETNREENNVTLQELDYHAESDEANYDLFIEGLSQKRRQVADALAPSKISLAEAQALAQERALKEGNVAAAVAVASKPSIILDAASSSTGSKSAPPPNAITNVPNQTITSIGKSLQESASSLTVGKKSADSNLNGSEQDLSNSNSASPKSSNSNLAGSTNANSYNNTVSSATNNQNTTGAGNTVPVHSVSNVVDDFIPDDDYQAHVVEKSFYDDSITTLKGHQSHQNKSRYTKSHDFETSDEENEEEAGSLNGNPLVAAYEEDIVPEKFERPSTTVSGGASEKAKSNVDRPVSGVVVNNTEDSEKKVKSSDSSPSKFCIVLSSSDEEPEFEENSVEIQDPLKHAPLNLDIDVSFFMKGFDEAQDKNLIPPSTPEVSSSTSHKSKKKDKDKDKERESKRKSKKSSSSGTGDRDSNSNSKSSHKKSSKHKKPGSSSNSKKDSHHPLDLEDFLNGGGPEGNSGAVDTNAYEAL